MPRTKRNCEICTNLFQPRSEAKFHPHTRCPDCRKATAAALEQAAEEGLNGLDQVTRFEREVPPEERHRLAAPLIQIVGDLETYALSPDWGVTLVASFLIHGAADGPVKKTITARDMPSWKAGKRSQDEQLARAATAVLQGGHVCYFHNGNRFDIPWLRTLALKYGFEFPTIKLIDPAAIAWKKYRLGRNSLDAMAQFLGLEEQKLHVGPEVWKGAAFDDDDECWKILVERCESDVRVLNHLAARVTKDIGMIDHSGSAFR
jgi:hypothetical protein